MISDIDDTVKRTGIPDGAAAVVRNTFFGSWEAVPGMADRYRGWQPEEGTLAVHYVSAGPWPLARPLSGFLFHPDAGFPEGSFHMREARKHLASIRTWRDLHGLLADPEATYRHKVGTITRILEDFPEREFVLVGDSG